MDMTERLERFLADVAPGRGARVVSYQPISGGYSRISARASVRWGDDTEETFILRGDPPAGSGVFVSDRDAEWELLRALPDLDSVATAPTRWYDATGDHLGAKCIVMDCADAIPVAGEAGRERRYRAAVRPVRGHGRGDPRQPARSTARTHGAARGLDLLPRQRARDLRPSGRLAPVGRTGAALRDLVGGRAPPATGPPRTRARRLPAVERADQRVPAADCDRLGVRTHRRSPRGPRLLQPVPTAAERVLVRSAALPRSLSCGDRDDRGADQSGCRRLLPDHRHGQSLRAADRRRRCSRRERAPRHPGQLPDQRDLAPARHVSLDLRPPELQGACS